MIKPSKSGGLTVNYLNFIRHSILPFNPHSMKSLKPTVFTKAPSHSFMPSKNLLWTTKTRMVSFWHLNFFSKISYTRKKSYNFWRNTFWTLSRRQLLYLWEKRLKITWTMMWKSFCLTHKTTKCFHS